MPASWVGDLARKHHTALNCLGQHRLARLRMLIPAECLARQKRIAEPLQRDESMTAALGLGQRRAQLLHPSIQVGRNLCLLAIFSVFVVFILASRCARRPRRTGSGLRIVGPLEVDSNLILLRRPVVRGSIAPLAAAVFAAQLDYCLVARRSQEMQCARQARVGGECQFVERLFDHLFSVGNAQVAHIYAALRSSYRFHLVLHIIRQCPSQGPHGLGSAICCIRIRQ